MKSLRENKSMLTLEKLCMGMTRFGSMEAIQELTKLIDECKNLQHIDIENQKDSVEIVVDVHAAIF